MTDWPTSRQCTCTPGPFSLPARVLYEGERDVTSMPWALLACGMCGSMWLDEAAAPYAWALWAPEEE